MAGIKMVQCPECRAWVEVDELEDHLERRHGDWSLTSSP